MALISYTYSVCGWQVLKVPSEYVSSIQAAHLVSVDEDPIDKDIIPPYLQVKNICDILYWNIKDGMHF